jgi:hypothetical protein
MPREVCVFTAIPCVSLDFWTFEYGVSRLRGDDYTWASGGPQELSTGCATVVGLGCGFGDWLPDKVL